MELRRRELLKLGLFGSAALMLPAERVARTQLALSDRIAESRLPKPFAVPFAVPPVLTPVLSGADTDVYSVTQQPASVEILPGLRTEVWGYNGLVPGPTIMVAPGRKTIVRQTNALPDVHPTLRYNVLTSTHLHGSPTLPQYDGYANDVTLPGQFKDYHYPVNPGHTLWYHDHGVHITAPNVYMGLAAMYIQHDALELSLPIPHGRYDVPLMLRDALFTSAGQLIFDDNSESGAFGDVILVNGRPWPAMPVERRKHRFRILNGSASRSFGLALSTGDPFTVIGTDGGLMPAPQQTVTIRHGMAERYEVVIDFANYGIGQRIVLENHSPENNRDFDTTNVIMAFDVVADATDTSNNQVPAVLNPANETMNLQPGQATTTRVVELDRHRGQWTINRQIWADVVNSGFTKTIANPALGDVEIWEFRNNSGGWFHPMHPHLVDFRILDRNGQPPFPYEMGPKDTVYVGENETVRVIMRFAPHRGRYMMHCHNTVHEDHDMMVQFEVGDGGDDPIAGDRARDLPAPDLELPDDPPGSPSSGTGSAPNTNTGPPPSQPSTRPTGLGSKARTTPKRRLKAKKRAKRRPRRSRRSPRRRAVRRRGRRT